MGWLKLFKPAQFKNSARLGDDRLAPLLKHLGRLQEVDAALAADAARYVIDDEAGDVLLRLAAGREAATKLGLSGINAAARWEVVQRGIKDRAAIFAVGAKLPPEL